MQQNYKIVFFQSSKPDQRNDIVIESMEMAGIRQHAFCEAERAQLQSELQKERDNAKHQEKLRATYATRKCAEKKKWLAEIRRLQDEQKSAEKDLNLFERMLVEKDRKIRQLEIILDEKDEKFRQLQGQNQELVNYLITLKDQLDNMIPHN
jgi:chromosome segregation ATPase